MGFNDFRYELDLRHAVRAPGGRDFLSIWGCDFLST